MPPRVSIILPTYNGERYLAEAIQSCLEQSLGDLELIIVVDGSSDRTLEIVKRFTDQRIQLIENPHNLGLPETLNVGFAAARGTYWTWSSDDNQFAPNALEVMLAELERHDTPRWVVAAHNVIDEHGRHIRVARASCACFLYPASVAREVGEYRPEFRLVEDTDFFLRLQHKLGPAIRIPRPLYFYRQHPNSLSATQIGARQFVTLRMHYDLSSRGIHNVSMHKLFIEQLAFAARYHAFDTMDDIMAFAQEKNVPFLASLHLPNWLFRTRAGWILVKIYIGVRSRLMELRETVAK